MSEILWLIAILAFIALEAGTYQMIAIWFMGGAICGLILSLCDANFWVQMIVFAAVSLILLLCFRPLAAKKFKTKLKTNADAAIGKTVIVTQEIDNIKGTGEAKLDGLIWTARAEDDRVLQPGTTATVKKIEGVKLIVS